MSDATAAPRAGIPLEVVLCAAGFCVSAAVVAVSSRLSGADATDLTGLFGWPVLGVAGGLALDNRPGSVVGRTLGWLSLGPVLVVVLSDVLPLTAAQLGPLVLACVVLGIVLGSERGAAGRTARRRLFWGEAAVATALFSVGVAWWWGGQDVALGTASGVLAVLGLAVARLVVVTDLRPLADHALDAALVVGVVVTGVGIAFLVAAGAQLAHMPAPGTTAISSGVVTVAMAAPAALWLRRSTLARRYGNGAIAPSDVADITADLHAQTQPRTLLDKAARFVATASGSPEARLVLGEEVPDVEPGWELHPLVVGGDHVGALLVDSGNPEGPELRQRRVVAQLLPTVALVARAVGLAVEAEHARRDVARERDAERARILGDLHDGLGPVLAGMSMRVQASLRGGSPGDPDLLEALADDLAHSRADLRRLVSGITPTALDSGDLDGALRTLVASLGSGGEGPRLTLDLGVDGPVPAPVQVAVYRSVAEGVTNALRHARASTIEVSVVTAQNGRGPELRTDVVDDGVGGPVAPGVGLTSLMSRAAGLGGDVVVTAVPTGGTRLSVRLPLGRVPT